MAYRCLDCGHLFEEGEQGSWLEDRGEFWGAPCREKMYGCPVCHGSYEETQKCEICGSECLSDELFGGVCDHCLEEAETLKDCFAVGKNEEINVKLNGFFAEMFSKEQIEEILSAHINNMKEDEAKKLFETYINSDKEWFGEMLSKVKKKENTNARTVFKDFLKKGNRQ